MKLKTSYFLLLFAALAWGSGFAVTKGALEQFPPYLLLLLRFVVAALAMAPFMPKRLKTVSRRMWVIGLVVGTFVFLGHLLQLIGIQYITSGKSAFLSAVYVVMVPFIVWMLRGPKPSGRQVAACFICLVGVGVISLDGGLTAQVGELLTLAGGICFALQIGCISRYAEGCDMLAFTWISVVVTAVCSLPAIWLTDWESVSITPQGIGSALYLGTVCSALAFSAQYTGMKYASPAIGTMLLSMESVFGGLTGVLLLGETVSIRMVMGCMIILASLMLGGISKKDGSDIK